MIIFPAIDLYEGKAVRLLKGDYRQMTVYSEHPEKIGAEFAAAGATHVHLVDLEGARDGSTPNLELILRLQRETGLFCEVGGGIREMETIRRYLEEGLDRVILGTAAVRDPALLEKALEAYGERIAVGIDARDGFVQTKGWVETTQVKATDLAAAVAKIGIRTIIYTDTATDGMLGGPNLTQMAAICDAAPTCQITASGGVSSPYDVENLKALERPNLRAAIVGKALYDGRTTLRDMNVAAL